MKGWKLQMADAFPWAFGEPTVRKCKDMLLTLRFYSQKPFFVTALALLVASPDQADPSGVTASFRFHPTH
ncbi:hypothetical protein CSV75_04935 [Sporosarcina sp. P18a]|nr:hypothetical protein CSV75_04935 [Sporosarcina sp. P18a]